MQPDRMSRAARKELETVFLLRTLINHGPQYAASLADRANEECDDERFEGLSFSRRGMGQKLNAMSLTGLVVARWKDDERLYLWSVTVAGREKAEAFDAA